jgi:hypothetical protein
MVAQNFSTNNDIRELWKGTSIELLKELHILTHDEKLNADSRRKLKQVYHLTQFIEPLIKTLDSKNTSGCPLTVVDMGAGKSYLGFILYDLLLREIKNSEIISIESRDELIERSQKLAVASNFERMKFISSSIEQAKVEGPIDLVCALHACDTATDDAILFGLRHQARAFALVPCCQAEVARLLKSSDSKKAHLHSLYTHPIHQREFGSHLTNVIRTLFLSSKGFKVTVSELVGWEHSMKNEIIIAEKISDESHPASLKAKKELEEIVAEFSVRPKLLADSNLESPSIA